MTRRSRFVAALAVLFAGVLVGVSAYLPVRMSAQAIPPPPPPPPLSAPCSSGAAPAQPLSGQASYVVGWNLAAGPGGSSLSGNQGSLYTFQGGDTSYEAMAAGASLQAGLGYWANFAQPTTVALTQPVSQTTVTLAAGQWVMIGNSGNSTAQVTGADCVMTYSPTGPGYQPQTTLLPGQGAWALSLAGGNATISGTP